MTELSDYRDRPPGSVGVSAGVGLAWQLPDALPSAPPEGTVTFLLSDIEGSTRLWEADRSAMTAAVARHYEILDMAVLGRGGIRPVEQGEGDSMVAVFARASDAARAALEAQEALQAEAWPEGTEIRVRMALHTGEAQLREGLYYAGPSIIRCARLRSLGHGGQVLVSAAAAELLADGLPQDAALLPLGLHRLKDLREAERVFQLANPALPATFPPLRAVEMLRHNLPTHLTSFVGRDAELGELVELLGRHRLVTLVGPGGCGKTRLAARVAEQMLGTHPDGVWWVELDIVTDPVRVPEAVLGAIGLDGKGIDPLTRITGYLADRRALLVLDNCEHVVGAAAVLLKRLLVACPQVAGVATSREPLRVDGETTWAVQPLSLPPVSDEVPLDVLLAAESVRLFNERATAARPTLKPDDLTTRSVAAICTRLDGIPLAIELAAARVRSLTPQWVLAGLTDWFHVLTGGSRTAHPRPQTLVASVEWSHDLLSQPERVLLRRLAVFTGGFDADSAQAVSSATDAPADHLPVPDVMILLSGLVDRSLVVFDGQRYRLLQTIRDFAARQLEATGEAPAARRAHLRHFVAVAASAARQLEARPSIPTLETLEAARENVLAAVDFALTTGDHEAAMSLCADMALFWQLHGRHSESLACVRRVLAETPIDPTPLRARILCAAGQLGFYTMDVAGGYGSVETAQAIEMARAVGCDEVLGRALGMQNLLATFGAPQGAPAGLLEAYAAAERAGDSYGMTAATAYSTLAWVFGCDRPELAEPHLIRLAEAADGSPVWAAWHGFVAGIGAWRAGRLWRAVDALTRADELAWSVGDPVLESWCATWLAETYLCLGDWASATQVIARSEAWMDRSSFGRFELVASRRITIGLASGDLAGAHRALEAIETAARAMGFPCLTLELAVLGARLALAGGDLAAAREGLGEATAIAETLGTPWYRASVADLAGRVALCDGEPTVAEDAHHHALVLSVEHGFHGVAAGTLESLAALACAGDSHAEAARLLGAADALRDATGQRRWPLDDPAHGHLTAALAGALGDDVLSALWQDGGVLNLREAASYATRARAGRKRPTTGWSSLTPTELEVAALAAQGLTNAEIGARLFITTGTAKVHLSHIYSKLSVANRTQLATYAVDRGSGRTTAD